MTQIGEMRDGEVEMQRIAKTAKELINCEDYEGLFGPPC